MNVMEAIAARRSVRAYADKAVSRETLEQLLAAAVQAPSAMNAQTWAFGVVQGRDKLRDLGQRARVACLAELDARGVTGGFRDHLADESYDPFYGADALLVIYATTTDQFGAINCSLAAANVMLAAAELGLGTCWIGIATPLLSEAEVKKEMGVPEDHVVVAPIIIGYPDPKTAEATGAREKNPPKVLYWR
jgi:nitroreductase